MESSVFIIGIGNSVNNTLTMTGSGESTLAGHGGNDTVTGGTANDTLKGDEGNDKLVGGTGDDGRDGGTGKDVMIGGKGDDYYIVDDVGDKVTETAKQGHDSVTSRLASYTLGLNVEDLALDPGALNGTGNALNNNIYGNALGNVLNGAAGRDYLIGNNGDDTLKGGTGSDILDGGLGADVMSGDSARDIFRYQVESAGELATLGGDTIIGFKSGEDVIELSDLIADFGIDPDFAFTGSYVILQHVGADTQLIFDRDGIGASVPVMLATITNANVQQPDIAVEGFASI